MSQFSAKRIQKYLTLARDASENSEYEQHRLGAVVIYKGVPLATGFNSKKTNPTQKFYNREREGYDVDADCVNNNSLHAEMACLLKIRNLDIDFSKVSIFVYRQHRDGTKGFARPCRACQAMIRDMGIRDVYYSSENGWCYERMD